jgi:predicted permease
MKELFDMNVYLLQLDDKGLVVLFFVLSVVLGLLISEITYVMTKDKRNEKNIFKRKKY